MRRLGLDFLLCPFCTNVHGTRQCVGAHAEICCLAAGRFLRGSAARRDGRALPSRQPDEQPEQQLGQELLLKHLPVSEPP